MGRGNQFWGRRGEKEEKTLWGKLYTLIWLRPWNACGGKKEQD